MIFENVLIFPARKFPEGNWQPDGLRFEDARFQSADGTQLHGWFFDQPQARFHLLYGGLSIIATARPANSPAVTSSIAKLFDLLAKGRLVALFLETMGNRISGHRGGRRDNVSPSDVPAGAEGRIPTDVDTSVALGVIVRHSPISALVLLVRLFHL